MSPALRDTNDGYFEHALTSGGKEPKMSSFIKKSINGGGYKDSRKPDVFGPHTVWKNGVAYPDSRWAAMGVVPKEHPYIKGRWVHPDRYDAIRAYYASRDNTRSNVQKAVSGGLDKATGTIGKEFGNLKSGGDAALKAYKDAHSNVQIPQKHGYPKFEAYNGSKLGEAAAYARGVVGNSAATKAVRKEVGNIKSGGDAALKAYKDAHTNVQTPQKHGYPKFEAYNGSKLGEAAAYAKGAIGSSAVGRAGRAAFETLTNSIESFKKGISKYLTGSNAGKNRAEALRSLQTQAGNLMGAISSALGTSEGRSGILRGAGKALGTAAGTVVGGAQGVAKGIVNSKIGQAAINSGRNVYGAVASRVGSALESISEFFKHKMLSAGAVRA